MNNGWMSSVSQRASALAPSPLQQFNFHCEMIYVMCLWSSYSIQYHVSSFVFWTTTTTAMKIETLEKANIHAQCQLQTNYIKWDQMKRIKDFELNTGKHFVCLFYVCMRKSSSSSSSTKVKETRIAITSVWWIKWMNVVGI